MEAIEESGTLGGRGNGRDYGYSSGEALAKIHDPGKIEMVFFVGLNLKSASIRVDVAARGLVA